MKAEFIFFFCFPHFIMRGTDTIILLKSSLTFYHDSIIMALIQLVINTAPEIWNTLSDMFRGNSSLHDFILNFWEHNILV